MSATERLSPFQPAHIDTGRSDCSHQQHTANRAGCAKLTLSISSPNGLGMSVDGYLCVDEAGYRANGHAQNLKKIHRHVGRKVVCDLQRQ